MVQKGSKRSHHQFQSAVRLALGRPRASTTGQTISNRLSRPFPVDGTAHLFPQDEPPHHNPTHYLRPVRDDNGAHVTFALHESPARSIAIANEPASSDEQTKQKHRSLRAATIIPAPAHKRHPSSEFPSHSYPQCLEDLYSQCGILPPNSLLHLPLPHMNNLLELWASANPLSAMHIMALATKWGLQPSIPGSRRLNVPRDRLNNEMQQGVKAIVMQRAYADAEQIIGQRIALAGGRGGGRTERVLGRAISKRRKHVAAQSGNMVLGEGKVYDVMGGLPFAVTVLYCEVSGHDMREELPREIEAMVADWRTRWPVSDHHLRRVVEKWSVAVERVDIDPGKAVVDREWQGRETGRGGYGKWSDVQTDGKWWEWSSLKGPNGGLLELSR